ncbi:6-phosphogluconate dehydrogenase C-terminal domain-like protein [Clavulina sp. PMI_390]|nr:6-phosphogluconate dehydrogenase C-terminal domain-like protein [Clavulina sp. PMI_390]
MAAVRIGIMSAGSMGAAVGHRITQNSRFETYTVVAGRSEATQARARDAGFKLSPSLGELIATTDVLFSILPPGDAIPFVREALPHIKGLPDRGAQYTFVDCNAVAPATSRTIAGLFEAECAASFVDGSIVGGPPKEGYSPAIYLSAKDDGAAKLEKQLDGWGIITHVLDGGVGAASALKMSYASMTKGLIGLVALSMMGANSNSVLQPLLAEISHSNTAAFSKVPQAASALPTKSYRWVAEMQEIGAYFAEAGVPEGQELFEGMAKLFDRTDKEKDGSLEEKGAGGVLREAARLAKVEQEKGKQKE